jgi:hypothetical protein
MRDRRVGYPADDWPGRIDHLCRPHTGEPIRVTVTGAVWRWRPTRAVVLLAGTHTACGPSSGCSCPYINFRTAARHARDYVAAHPDLAGKIIRRRAAIDAAGQTLGSLLHPSDRSRSSR